MRPKQTLLVDDDHATRVGLADLLRGDGYACVEAQSLRDAVALMQMTTPDLLIIGIRLDVFSRLQLVINRPRHMPAIVITGFPDSVLQAEAERSGAIYLRKPVAPRQLIALIERLLSPT